MVRPGTWLAPRRPRRRPRLGLAPEEIAWPARRTAALSLAASPLAFLKPLGRNARQTPTKRTSQAKVGPSRNRARKSGVVAFPGQPGSAAGTRLVNTNKRV